MPTEHINPAGVSTPTGYTHVVSSDGSRIVFLAGQVPLDSAGNIVGKGDFSAQARQVFENLETCLAAAGASFADVTKMTTFIVNYTPALRPELAAVRAAYLPSDKPPASTLVGVQALANPDIMIEVEAVAVLA
jgi:enamine deaminase RidA (YjgF/YER057c/UK114 family)